MAGPCDDVGMRNRVLSLFWPTYFSNHGKRRNYMFNGVTLEPCGPHVFVVDFQKFCFICPCPYENLHHLFLLR